MGSQIVPFGGSQTLDPKGPGVSDPPIQGLRSRDPKISGSGSMDSRVPTCQIWRSQGLDPWIPGLGTLFQRGIRLRESVSTWNPLVETLFQRGIDSNPLVGTLFQRGIRLRESVSTWNPLVETLFQRGIDSNPLDLMV